MHIEELDIKGLRSCLKKKKKAVNFGSTVFNILSFALIKADHFHDLSSVQKNIQNIILIIRIQR